MTYPPIAVNIPGAVSVPFRTDPLLPPPQERFVDENLNIFASIVTAIVLEAAPFLLLGSVLGALFEVCVPRETVERLIPKSTPGRIAVGILAGVVLPTCECGVVPIVRRMLRRGVPASAAVPYMMAAPVVNPVVLLSTWMAYRADPSMVLWRVLVALVPAVVMGAVLARASAEDVLQSARPRLQRMGAADPGADGHAHHEHEHGCGCGCDQEHRSKTLAVLSHAASEFLEMSTYLILGACAAGAFKTLLTVGFLASFEVGPVISVAAMMVLAVLLSVCSEADAFVAASFTMFPRSAQLAFMALGPMLDLKLTAIFLGTFRRRVILALVVVPVAAIFVTCLLLGWGLGGAL